MRFTTFSFSPVGTTKWSKKTIWIILNLGKYFGTSEDDMKQTTKLRSMFNGRS
jgi:hypothetical protein